MSLEEINKWLDNEYGVSYTRLEELHDFYFEKYCDLKEENKKLKEKQNYDLKWALKYDELYKENQELIKEKIRLLVIIQKALKTNVINGEDMKFITKLHKELGSGINE